MSARSDASRSVPVFDTSLAIVGLESALAGPFDLNLSAGEAVAITGPSGSGKSLLLRMVADLDPNRGDVILRGRHRREFAAPTWRGLVTYVAAESGWWAENVADHFTSTARTKAAALAERLGLKRDLMAGSVARLSTGEKQRIALIRALVLDSPVLLLDEPTGPLDPASVERVETLLEERLAAGLILLMVTHDPAQVTRLRARHFRMQDGRLHAP